MSSLFLFKKIDDFKRGTSGAVAVEFAIIFAILFVLFLGLVEVENYIDVHRKIELVAATSGDLASELIVDEGLKKNSGNAAPDKTDKQRICSLLSIGMKNLYPYEEHRLSASMHYFNGNKKEWTAFKGDKTIQSNAPTSVPEWLLDKYRPEIENSKMGGDDFGIVNIQVNFRYAPVLTSIFFGDKKIIDMTKDYWVFLRNTKHVSCENCSSNQQCL